MSDKPPFTQKHQTAYHEAGHAVIAWLCNHEVISVTIRPDEEAGSLGTMRHDENSLSELFAPFKLTKNPNAPGAWLFRTSDTTGRPLTNKEQRWETLSEEFLEIEPLERDLLVAAAGEQAERKLGTVPVEPRHTNAIGGVIDFQTPEPTSDFNGDVTGQYGGLGMTSFLGNIGAGTKDGKVGFNLGIARTAFTEGIDGEDDADNSSVRGRIDFNPLNKTNISGRIYASDAFVRLNLTPDTMGTLPGITQIIDANRGVNFVPDANDPDNLQRSDFFSGQIALTQIINSQLVFKAGYASA